MTASMVAILIFLSIVSGLGAILLGVRELFGARPASVANGGQFRLQRLPRLEQGGQPGPIARFDRWFARVVLESGLAWDTTSAGLLLVLSGMVLGGALFLWAEQPLAAGWGLLVGSLLPLGYFVRKQRQRRKQLQEQLPLALDMMARGVRAGQSLDQAFDLLGKHGPEPLATEFRRSSQHLEMGLSMPAAMRSFLERVRLDDARIFATTLAVHRETGGNVAQALERLAVVVRDRLSYRRQLRVATGAGRISAILVGAVAPLVFLFFFVFRPEYLRSMFESPMGQSMFVLAIVLELVGLIWTARLLRPTL